MKAIARFVVVSVGLCSLFLGGVVIEKRAEAVNVNKKVLIIKPLRDGDPDPFCLLKPKPPTCQ
jgi:hypothetical protein